MNGVTEVWVRLRGHEPVPGLALAWGDRLGGRWAFITYEFDGRVRTEWLPLTALMPRLSDSDVALDQAAAATGQVDDPSPGVRAS